MKNLRAVEQGGTVLQPKHPLGPHSFRVFLLDSDGNRIALHSALELTWTFELHP